MSWFFIALLAPACYAATNYIDKYLISKYFNNRGTGAVMIFSTLAGLITLPFILLFQPDAIFLSFNQAILVLLSGFIQAFALLPYFYALKEDETSAIVPIYQSIPVFSYLLGYFLLNEILASKQVLGMILIIAGSMGISLELIGKKIRFKAKPFFYMIFSSVLIAVSSLIFKYVSNSEGFGKSIFWFFIGAIIFSFTLLIFIRSYREQFFDVFRKNGMFVVKLNLINEFFEKVAEFSMNYAIVLVPVALAWTVNGFQPFFIFFYGIILSIFFPHIIKENLAARHLIKKLVLIIIIFIGGYMLVR